MSKDVTILTGEPTVSLIAKMQLDADGISEMIDWVQTHRPECLPENIGSFSDPLMRVLALFPHDGTEPSDVLWRSVPRELTDNELLVELAGRKCYDSFGLKAGRKSNADYIANTQMHVDPRDRAAAVVNAMTGNDGVVKTTRLIADDIEREIRDAQNAVPHASILYHAKMTFFIGGVSRRVSHELIRNYVGADRDEEGSPSQESTRYTEHYGFYVAHPYILRPTQRPSSVPGAVGPTTKFDEVELENFGHAMQDNYDEYRAYVVRQTEAATAGGKKLSTIERKRILESASPYLSHACETSWIWTTNPGAIAKMIKERDNDGADLEFRRLARVIKRVAVEEAPNLFPQPWMRAS